MKQFNRIRQSGSVLGFVIVGIVLVGLLAGGVYLVRHSMTATQPTGEQTPITTETPAADSTPSEQPSVTAPAEQPRTAPSPSTDGTSSATLPQTGPSDTVFSAISVAALLGAGIGYARSRRFDLRYY